MKPDWKDAPEWAKWMAMGMNGTWLWYEYEPASSSGDGEWLVCGGKYTKAGISGWKETKEKRP